MEFGDLISQKKEIYETILEYIDKGDHKELIENLEKFHIHEDRNQFIVFLRLISKISKNHHRDTLFFDKFEQIFLFFSIQIKEIFSNFEIFKIFKNNPRILLLLIKHNILILDKSLISTLLQHNNNYRYYFYSEIKSVIDTEQSQEIEQELLAVNSNIFDSFDEKCKLGENHSYICSLIRNDNVKEFVSYVNQKCINLRTRKIKHSIFETNPFFKNSSPSLIEYATFFGSIQIFNYMRMNKVELSSSLWIYAIHSNNAEMIHLLEQYHVKPIDSSYEDCFKEAVKCHHNSVANYILNNFIQKDVSNASISFSLQFHNFEFLDEIKDTHSFFNLACKYDYVDIVKFIFNSNKSFGQSLTAISNKCENFMMFLLSLF